MKPIINLSEVELIEHKREKFHAQYAPISESIGAKLLGYSLTVLPPGKVTCPYHNHHGNEELFIVLEGLGELRFGENTYPLKKDDLIACPPGGRDVAHQIINTGEEDLRYLSVSTQNECDIIEYPDSNKIGALVGSFKERRLRYFANFESQADYFDGELDSTK